MLKNILIFNLDAVAILDLIPQHPMTHNPPAYQNVPARFDAVVTSQ